MQREKKKPKLSTRDQIEKLKEKGIKFNAISEQDASNFLENRNYYYRVASFRKNFTKVAGLGYDIDFSVLVDLSSIDLYLREFLFSLCLDVEHTMKTILMKDLTYNENEDGYSIIQEYRTKYPEFYSKLENRFSKNQYLADMHKKRHDVSVWVFLEVADFGSFTRLLELYTTRNQLCNSALKSATKHLRYVKNVRNACAHNNIFLINIFNRKSNLIRKPTQLSLTACNRLKVDSRFRRFNKTHDLLVLAAFHKRFCSADLNRRRYEEGKRVFNRFQKSPDYLMKSTQLSSFLDFFIQFLDFIGN